MNDEYISEAICGCTEAEDCLEDSIIETGKLIKIEKEGYPNDTSETSASTDEISTDSARTYKFVNQWELQCKCDGDEEGGNFEDERSCEDFNFDEFDKKNADIERTLAIIKPEAVINRNAIEYRIKEAGFEIQQTRWLKMTLEQVSEFYADRYDNPQFAHLLNYMAASPIIVHVLAKEQAVKKWRMMMGPTKVSDARLYFPDSIRARYGTKGQDYKNVVHGSETCEEAEREIHFFFPNFIIEPFLKWKKAEDYLWETVNKLLAKGLALCCKEKPEEPILWLGHWLLANNPHT